MNTNTSISKCPQCGAMMKQQAADGKYALYHCSCCGHNATVAMTGDSNAEYLRKRLSSFAVPLWVLPTGRPRNGIICVGICSILWDATSRQSTIFNLT